MNLVRFFLDNENLVLEGCAGTGPGRNSVTAHAVMRPLFVRRRVIGGVGRVVATLGAVLLLGGSFVSGIGMRNWNRLLYGSLK